MTVLEPTVATEAPTEETGPLPRVPDRERRRATATVKQLAPGRYLAIEDAGEVILLPLTDEVTHLGRSQSADIVLDDASVSRRHAVVALRAGRMVVLDDRSLNGVVVNGARVREAALDDGDTIVLGRVVLRYHEVDPR
ncbi:MAG TPA: FHA domain-containing protein [Solirubrobacteraceae bacterium]